MADIFVSYKREDRDRILPLVGAIEARGYTCWWDLELLPGDRWKRLIETELSAARCIIVAWTHNAVGADGFYLSRWVEFEAANGYRRGILVPVLLDSGAQAAEHEELHYANLCNWSPGRNEHELERLCKSLEHLVGTRSRPRDLELEAWLPVERAPSPAMYSEFVAKFPTSRFADIARSHLAEMKELADWSHLSPSSSDAQYEQFIAKWPHGRFAGEARTVVGARNANLRESVLDAAWTMLKTSTDRDDYLKFLRDFPDSRHAREARRQLSDLIAWNDVASGDMKAHELFLSTPRFPAMQHHADERLRTLRKLAPSKRAKREQRSAPAHLSISTHAKLAIAASVSNATLRSSHVEQSQNAANPLAMDHGTFDDHHRTQTLQLEGVMVERAFEGSTPCLYIKGEIRSQCQMALTIPKVCIELRDAEDKTVLKTVHRLPSTPGDSAVVEAWTAIPFQATLFNPPHEATDLAVSLIDDDTAARILAEQQEPLLLISAVDDT